MSDDRDSKNNSTAILKNIENDIKTLQDSVDMGLSDNQEREFERARKHNVERKKLEVEKLSQQNQNLRSNRELKEKYASKTFNFMLTVIMFSFLVILGLPFIPILLKYFGHETYIGYLKLETIPLKQVLYIIPASMALFGWVLKGLFSYSK